jgi:hypothetical protein
VSFATAAVLPFLLLPLALILVWWARNRHVTPLDAVLSAFARGFSPYAALTFLFELLVGLITTAFTGHFLQLPKADTALALFIFAVWGSLATLEEYIKYRYGHLPTLPTLSARPEPAVAHPLTLFSPRLPFIPSAIPAGWPC